METLHTNDKFEYIVNLFVEYLKQDVKNSIKCEPIQRDLLQLIDMKHQKFLKTSEKNVDDTVQLYKDVKSENETSEEDKEPVEEGCGSSMEGLTKLIPLWFDCWAPEHLHVLDNYIPDWKEIIEEARQKEQEAKEMKTEIRTNMAILKTFETLNNSCGALVCTTDGNFLWTFEMSTFGNPDDKCWKLALELGLPIFYRNNDVKDTREEVYTRITKPENPMWFYSPSSGKLGFYPDGTNPKIANFDHIGILLTNPFDDRTECRIAYTAKDRPIYIEDGVRLMIESICEYYGRVPKDLVYAISDYYMED